MKNKLLAAMLASVTSFVVFPEHACAQAPENNGGRILFGYKSLKLNKPIFPHNTHPDDSFLPDADVPGSAGVTSLDGLMHFCAVGVGYQPRLSDSVSLNVDAGLLIGSNRKRRQNANDDRPAANGTFIYTEVQFGMFATAGLSYHIKGFSIGAEA